MFISVLDLFKIGVGPSSSHTMGPMIAAVRFLGQLNRFPVDPAGAAGFRVRCTLKGSLAYTGRGHATDRAVVMGLHGYTPGQAAKLDVDALLDALMQRHTLSLERGAELKFQPAEDVVFDQGPPLPQHPNGMQFELLDVGGQPLLQQVYFSVGGGFVVEGEAMERSADWRDAGAAGCVQCPYGFSSAAEMVAMAETSGKSISAMKYANELGQRKGEGLRQGLDTIWDAMRQCVRQGLSVAGTLPGGLEVRRRAKRLAESLRSSKQATLNDWLCAYAMAVNEENAAGHLVVTAPTNGAAGVIPAVLYYLVEREGISQQQVREFLLTAAAIGGLIKYNSSISGAEVGCQGEVGSASAMAAAGLCAVRGGTPRQVEKAAEIALEHHLGMTCDPVKGLVQIPCIERNGFGAVKAWSAASLSLHEGEAHQVSLDTCIAAMQSTGEAMSHKYKETSLGGLAVSYIEC